jgi:hypothetical protein
VADALGMDVDYPVVNAVGCYRRGRWYLPEMWNLYGWRPGMCDADDFSGSHPIKYL